MATIFGIESTCDETAAAVVRDGYDVRASTVATQVEIHAIYRGVVPEIASRAHIENILPVMAEALKQAGISASDIDAVAVTHRPGLIGSLLIGVTAAKTLAWALQKPLIGVDHVHAHLYSVLLNQNVTSKAAPMPALGLAISGGHTALYHIRDFLNIELIGSTIDDAVGEAYDKVAAILGLGYPGGPIIDRLAQNGNPNAIRFPRSMLGRQSLDFSFSGLKTSVLYHVRGYQGRQRPVESLGRQEIADVAASFQAACIDILIRKLRRAIPRIGAKSVIIGGGVSANQGLRSALASFPIPVFFPPLLYCTDNAAMSAGLAHLYYARNQFSPLSLDAITHSEFRRAVSAAP
jgi:N6-L-threonylcarbamoyladenine synthase